MSLTTELDKAMKFARLVNNYIPLLDNSAFSFSQNSSWPEKYKMQMVGRELEKHRNKVNKLIVEIDKKYSFVPSALTMRRQLKNGLDRLENFALPYVN
ncbi:MAG: hypothetical protein WC511_00235 [Candidatus Pacearchaeota archaeon]|jgi:hypothetical protein